MEKSEAIEIAFSFSQIQTLPISLEQLNGTLNAECPASTKNSRIYILLWERLQPLRRLIGNQPEH